MARALRLDFGASPKEGSVSRSALCQARPKILPSYYEEVDSGIREIFYRGDNVERWKGLRVVAVDGTSLQTNEAIYCDWINSLSEEEKENLEDDHFHTFYKEKQLHGVTLHDCLNDICLGYVVDFKSFGERELTARLSEMIKRDMLVVLDRGFPAVWFFRLFERLGSKYLMRLKTTHNKDVKEFYESGDNERDIDLELSGEDCEKLEKSGYKSYRGTKVRVRLIRCEFNGQVRIFATNLKKKKASCEEIGQLYCKRWEIEKSYNRIKTYLALEGWRFNSKEGMKLDLAIKILLYNLSSIISRPAIPQIAERQKEREKKAKAKTGDKKNKHEWNISLCKAYSIEALMAELLAVVRMPVRDLKDFKAAVKNYIADLVKNVSDTIKNRPSIREKTKKPDRGASMNRKLGI
jgi:hypothetical protein